MRQLIGLCFLFLVNPLVAAEPAATPEVPRALENYVAQPDATFSWKLRGRLPSEAGTVYDVELISQTWQKIVWKHDLLVCEPQVLKHPRHVLLFVTGGANGRPPSQSQMALGLQLAALSGARVAMLHQVPNQPLFDGRVEDDLITETWLRFLETGDPSWPLLFPMVKSVVRAMDALEELARTEWKEPVKGFVVTGASKRGWTTWLSPVVDDRIVAIAPMVINTLNFQPQMRYQLETWGKYSEQIDDYTRKGLVKLENETPREIELRTWMDPFTYRKQLTLPKLLIHGTNDRYWVVDATKLYWDELVGPKYILQVPNAGHNLKGGESLALSTLAAYFQLIATGTQLPELTSQHSAGEDAFVLKIESQPPPLAASLWTAHSATKDFREARWESRPLMMENGSTEVRIPKSSDGHVAFYGECRFEYEGVPYSLCTLIQRE